MCPPRQRQPTLSKLAPSSPLRYNPSLQGTSGEVPRSHRAGAYIAPAPGVGVVSRAEVLAMVDGTEERFWEAELYRLKGQMTLDHLLLKSCT